MIVKYDEDNFSIKLYRDFVKGKLVGLMEVIPIDELLEVWADRKTENNSEKPNNSTISKMEQVDKDINVRSKDEPQNKCKTCRLYYQKDTRPLCRECDEHSWYDPIEDEPQTERGE